jgi:hypothetical protein
MVVVKRDFPELVARAEQIVVGTVTEIRESHDESRGPLTLVTFSDLIALKGDVGPTLTLSLAGGAVGSYRVHIPDMPTFTIGERAVLFVAGNGRDVCPLVGVWQGRFHVRFDATRGTEVVESHDRLPVVGLAGRELRYARPAALGNLPAAMTLDEFRQLIVDEMALPQATDAATR